MPKVAAPALIAAVCTGLVLALAFGCERSPRPGYEFSPDADAGTDDAGPGAADADDPDDECDPQEVCEDYCHEKHVRCLGSECDGVMTNYASSERQFCINGIETETDEGETETLLEGCVERASESQETCEQKRDKAEVFADQPCDSDEQRYRQCNELRLYLSVEAATIHAACGCPTAAAGQSCDADEDCDDWGDGICLNDVDAGTSICTAGCHDFDENPPFPLLPDPSCASHNGVCVDMSAVRNFSDHGPVPPMPPSSCQRYCTSVNDCPGDSSCAPVFPLADDEVVGLCSRDIQWDVPFEFCEDPDDCPVGTGCVEGTCQPHCDGDPTLCHFGDCGPDDYCDINFVDLF